MTIKVLVFDVQANKYEAAATKTKPATTVHEHRQILLDASDGPKLAQMVELMIPANEKPAEVGKYYLCEITSILNVFGGRPRIVGKLRDVKQ